MTKHIIETPYGTVETNYNEDEDICTSFEYYRSSTEPLTLAEIGEIIEAIYKYYDYSHNNPYNVPKNFHLEIPLLQAKLIQQKYKRKD